MFSKQGGKTFRLSTLSNRENPRYPRYLRSDFIPILSLRVASTKYRTPHD